MNGKLEKANDGLESFTSDRGSKVGKGLGSFGSLRPGTPVAVQHTMKGIQSTPDWKPNGVNINQRTVASVDRRRSRISITFANGGTETVHSDHSFTAHSSRVIGQNADELGRRVARFVKPAH